MAATKKTATTTEQRQLKTAASTQQQ